jgi:hypothetical protein
MDSLHHGERVMDLDRLVVSTHWEMARCHSLLCTVFRPL